jgi:decaprenylphospho-beta-D-erythro-pentofuranosid-2-ulose 2-reductase
MTTETWIILGASSPISQAFGLEAAQAGHKVVLCGRSTEALTSIAADISVRSGSQSVSTMAFDALAYDQHVAFAEQCDTAVEGTLGVFVAVGGQYDEPDAWRFEDVRHTIETTYLGVVSVLTAFAPLLQGRGDGYVVVLSSVAGDRGRAANHVYGSAKAGLTTYLQGLRARLGRNGVNVVTIKPGYIDTAMTWGLKTRIPVASPQDAGRAFFLHAHGKRAIVYYPWFWRPIMLLVRLMPEAIMKRARS